MGSIRKKQFAAQDTLFEHAVNSKIVKHYSTQIRDQNRQEIHQLWVLQVLALLLQTNLDFSHPQSWVSVVLEAKALNVKFLFRCGPQICIGSTCVWSSSLIEGFDHWCFWERLSFCFRLARLKEFFQCGRIRKPFLLRDYLIRSFYRYSCNFG